MLNFTIGPVQSTDSVKKIGAENVPYFRTPEFSELMLDNEKLMLEFSGAPKDSKVVFITGSGTASMEATIINTLNKKDKVLVINGGSFGQRFVDILSIHEIPYEEIKLDTGRTLKAENLEQFEGRDFTTFIVNIHETSTGVLYNIRLISDFCQRNGLLLIVDAISSFLADPIDMYESHIDVLITGSQKALACPPGISIIVLSPRAVEKVYDNNPKCLYLNLKEALENQKRGQTPFTPAVGILLQIHARLEEIKKHGGAKSENERMAILAAYFREKIRNLPFEILSECMSNAVTPLHPTTTSAYEIFTVLKDQYSIWVCPNGGILKETIFRVGHLGDLRKEDYDQLIGALFDLQKRGII